VGPLGISGNPIEIKAVSDEFKAALDALLDIESDVYRTHGPDPTEPVRKIMLGMTDEMFVEVESLPQRVREAIERAQNHKEKDGPLSLSIDMKFTFERGKEFSAALSRMTSSMKPEDWNSYF
jgi:hypothetical protein